MTVVSSHALVGLGVYLASARVESVCPQLMNLQLQGSLLCSHAVMCCNCACIAACQIRRGDVYNDSTQQAEELPYEAMDDDGAASAAGTASNSGMEVEHATDGGIGSSNGDGDVQHDSGVESDGAGQLQLQLDGGSQMSYDDEPHADEAPLSEGSIAASSEFDFHVAFPDAVFVDGEAEVDIDVPQHALAAGMVQPAAAGDAAAAGIPAGDEQPAAAGDAVAFGAQLPDAVVDDDDVVAGDDGDDDARSEEEEAVMEAVVEEAVLQMEERPDVHDEGRLPHPDDSPSYAVRLAAYRQRMHEPVGARGYKCTLIQFIKDVVAMRLQGKATLRYINRYLRRQRAAHGDRNLVPASFAMVRLQCHGEIVQTGSLNCVVNASHSRTSLCCCRSWPSWV
jgi:hypothetical protein